MTWPTQVTVTGVVQLSPEQPASGAVVSFLLSEEISNGATAIYPQAVTTRCASDGSFSITVNANDDLITNPQGSSYKVTITYGSTTIREDRCDRIQPAAVSDPEQHA